MSRLVYIKEIRSDGWLHWSFRNGSSELRDFRHSLPKLTRHEIERLLARPGNCSEKAPRERVEEKKFWREHLGLRNIESGFEEVPNPDRLLDVFTNEAGPLLEDNNHRRLQIVFENWNRRFGCIVNRERPQFNHWDDTDAHEKRSHSTGIGWTSYLLEYCRSGRECKFVDTGHRALDFSLLAMDLNLGISSKRNWFQPRKRDFIKPDGLGVREDGSFCVLEVKGPQDKDSLRDATLQAVCGGLAVHARREMLVRIARTEATRRVKVSNARIPRDIPSLGLYVMMSATTTTGRRMFDLDRHSKLEDAARLILRSFRGFRDIAYFCIDTHSVGDFSELSPCLVVMR
jgi:hypothetical protein